MIFKLDRPQRPALPNSYFWTWDHSTNWVLDDPGAQVNGCYNNYLKRPETFVEDYRRLTDLAAGLGIKGIVIWGFLRDSHGGVEASKRVASYAASKNVAIMPGFGTTWYGGAYYQGSHKYCLTNFLREHPDARMLGPDGKPVAAFGLEHGACPMHPAFKQWLADSLHWLFREFEIGGINLENGDFLVDHHPLTQAARKDWPADDPEVYFFQGLSYRQAIDALRDQLDSKLITYATYNGFNYGETAKQDTSMGKAPPAMLKILPEKAITQWTLTGMLLKKPLPLSAYLDDGAPAAVFDNPNWPRDLRPVNQRSVGFVHQGSQWHGDRHDLILSWIKESCLRAHLAGLEGVSIHGEVSSRHIPAALNYLAFSHFTHWPIDTLRDFGRKTLGQVLGSEREGEDFVELLVKHEAGTLTDPEKKSFKTRARFHGFDTELTQYERAQFWLWLGTLAMGHNERHTATLL